MNQFKRAMSRKYQSNFNLITTNAFLALKEGFDYENLRNNIRICHLLTFYHFIRTIYHTIPTLYEEMSDIHFVKILLFRFQKSRNPEMSSKIISFTQQPEPTDIVMSNFLYNNEVTDFIDVMAKLKLKENVTKLSRLKNLMNGR